MAAVLHELRGDDRSDQLKNYATFSTTLSERDHNAIRKTFSGLIKLIYPDNNYTPEEAYEIIDFAAESRKRVKDQLYVIDETFRAEPATFEYTKPDGTKVQIETLERVGLFGMPSVSEPVEEPKPETASGVGVAKPLAAKSIEVRLNQTGVSYKTLFADYLRTAHVIEITDPFIRLPYQVYNLIDFIQMLKETNDAPEELKVILHTNADSDEAVPEMIDIFDSLQDDLRSFSIDFSYDFTADHDRKIVADNGWSIFLGRGLDIFEPYPKFTMGCAAQENRRCRAFSVTYTNQSDTSDSMHMKALAIRQPWATLVAAGIKDVECRENMRPPCKRFLITASVTRDAQRLEDVLPDDLLEEVNGYIQQGKLPPYEEWPTGAIIGYADIDNVTYDPVDSPWAYGHEGIKYVLKNAHMLDNPILGKNKATPFFYNVEGYDEDHLPPAHIVKQ